MESDETRGVRRIDHLFDLAEARFDRWRDLLDLSHQWVASIGTKDAATRKSRCEELLGEILPVEDFHAYPGARLLATLKERLGGSEVVGTTARAARFRGADAEELSSRPGGVGAGRGSDGPLDDAGAADHRVGLAPFFEVLFVVPSSPAKWPLQAQQVRRLRRPRTSPSTSRYSSAALRTRSSPRWSTHTSKRW